MLIGGLIVGWALAIGAILAGWSRLHQNDRAVRGIREELHEIGADEPGYELSEAGWATRQRPA
ncbi:MAG: hypothetical protein IT306_11785 [Chloroflexi bacterium]|nr:hypothetical protein [Chloroflexota bacterium]